LSERDWKKELKEFGEAWEQRFQGLEKSLREIGEQSSNPNPASSQEADDMPLYKCKDGNCAFATDDLDAYIDHKIAHKTKEKPTEEAATPAPRMKHGNTPPEIMDCPDCWAKFEREFERRGKRLVDKEPEKPAEKPKKRSLF